MATVRSTCPDCGDVDMTSREVTVRVCIDDNAGTYIFRCPECTMVVVKSAKPRIVDLLSASGVPVQRWLMPLELNERPDGPPITHDDIIDFHYALQDTQVLDPECADLTHPYDWEQSD